jgi:diacylglycerol kinase (ATP)
MTMQAPEPSSCPYNNPQKHRRGLQRLWHATLYSLQGLRMAWAEPAFRSEALLLIAGLPLAYLLGGSWVEVAVLVGSLVLLLVIELLNTAIEVVVDRIGPEWHPLSGRAKDLGSAAVLLWSLSTTGLWGVALWRYAMG